MRPKNKILHGLIEHFILFACGKICFKPSIYSVSVATSNLYE